nr:vitellogenin-like [Leptinotarsa decemlineata]
MNIFTYWPLRKVVNMWSSVILGLFVGITLASNTPGWKDNTEYVYKVRGRTLTAIEEISKHHSGIFLKATIRIQTRPDGKIQGVISEPEYSQIHSQLPECWKTHIPDSELTWKPLDLSGKPFQAELKYGVITDLIVSEDVPNWEANILKGIMSQFQLNTKEAISESSQSKNRFEPTVFSVMEDTITGNSDTLYEVKIKPRFMFESRPWEIRMLQKDGDIIEIVKDKDFNNSIELPSYFYGFARLDNSNPATNQMGEFFIRHSISRAVLTGNPDRYMLHNSYTVNEIMVNPTLNDNKKASVVSVMNVTLEEVRSHFEILEEVADPVRLGNLVYAYEKPFTQSEVREKRPYNLFSDEPEYSTKVRAPTRRLIRSIYEDSQDFSEESYKQDEPSMRQPPESPFLPFTTGFKGKSIKYRIDIVYSVQELARQIAREMEDVKKMIEKSSTSKFVTLASLIRIMNEDELKKTVNALYTNVEEGLKRDTWVVFLHAVAEAGTAPAFLTIQSLIKSDKIQGSQASHVVSTMGKSVRTPSSQYMKAYFELIKSPKVRDQSPLNATAILSYTDLVRKVYFDEAYYRKQFPQKSFVGFHNKEGIRYIRETVIPYLTKQLHESIEKADTEKIHTYIRALGNVADLKILEAFKDYLEGKKQASQFQRLLMVVALDELVKLHPREISQVLFSIYSNLGETKELRTAAAYLIINRDITVEALEHMAAYTRIDTNDYVNAAVKASILRAAELKDPEFHNLRKAAIAAKPLLTKKAYGMQFGADYLETHFIEKLNIKYKNLLRTFGSEDSFFPKGFEYGLHSKSGELKYDHVHIQAMLTSIKQLIRVGREQTSKYQEMKRKQEERAEEQHQYPWSSQNIAGLLNMKPEVREQLEGVVYSKEMGSVFRMLSFDNSTVEKIPELIRKVEEELEKGKKFNYLRLTNRGDMALSFPTEMGLPFHFTYDVPTIIQSKGKVQAEASPKFSKEGKINLPDNVNINFDIYFAYTSKVQGIISFTTPFDHQQYSSGFEKHWQVHFLLKSRIDIDVKNQKAEINIEEVLPRRQIQMFHYSVLPYTCKNDIMNFDHSQANTHILVPPRLNRFDEIQLKKQTGYAIRWMMDHEIQNVDSINLGKLLVKEGPFIALLGLWDDANVQYGRRNVTYYPEESTTERLQIKLGYKQQYFEKLEHFRNMNKDNMIEEVSAGINNVKVDSVNISFHFHGEKNIKYDISGAFAKSNVHPQSRLAVSYTRSGDSEEAKPYEARLKAESLIPNTGAIDLNDALETDPAIVSNLKLSFGAPDEEVSKIETEFYFRRSEERKHYLKQLSMYRRCKDEMRDGNKQLPTCVNMTMEANLLDHVKVHVNHQNLPRSMTNVFETIFSYIKVRSLLTKSEFEPVEKHSSPKQLIMEARFHPDLRFVNISVESKNERSLIPDLPVGYMTRRVFVAHPVFHLKNRVMSGLLALKTFRPFCAVDKTYVGDHLNYTYPADISKHWTVMFQYVPREATHNPQEYVEEQLASEIENCVVLVRKNPESENKKDVKVVMSFPETDFKPVDITMTPKPQVTSGPKATVTVNGVEIEISEDKSHDIEDGFIQIYALPGGEVKMEVNGYFYVIYDGERIRASGTNGYGRNDVRGLCGQFNDQIYENKFTPQNCITLDSQKFVLGYEVEGPKGQAIRKLFAKDPKQCIRKENPVYVEVIPKSIWKNEYSSEESQFSQTKYVYEDGKICFTIKPVVSCRRGHQAQGYITKSVPVHCVAKSNVAQLWKTQIDKGSSPDFSHKEENKRVQMQIPQSCSK